MTDASDELLESLRRADLEDDHEQWAGVEVEVDFETGAVTVVDPPREEVADAGSDGGSDATS